MIEVLILSIALSMDAFAVSIGLGAKKKTDLKPLAIKAGIYFGFFQAVMPLIGFLGNKGLKEYIGGYDSVVAFILLLFIGSKMINESFQKNEDEIIVFSNKILLVLAVATSIDAIAAGFTLHLFSINPFICVVIIGLTTFLLSIIGVFLGGQGATKYESKAEILGGVILILIGFKILISSYL